MLDVALASLWAVITIMTPNSVDHEPLSSWPDHNRAILWDLYVDSSGEVGFGSVCHLCTASPSLGASPGQAAGSRTRPRCMGQDVSTKFQDEGVC